MKRFVMSCWSLLSSYEYAKAPGKTARGLRVSATYFFESK
jgi:hypothetical protein